MRPNAGHRSRHRANWLAAMAVAPLLVASLPPGGAIMAAQPALFNAGDAYERFMGRWSRRLAPRFLEFAGVAADTAVLDIGSGTGALAFAAADIAGVTVLGIDPSEAYVRRAAAQASGDGVRFAVGDAQALDLPAARFDATLSLLVLNFIPDRAAAVREMVRVTRPGGVVAAAVWDYGDGMEMLRTFWDEAVSADPAAEPRDERHMPLSRRGELAAVWQAAGLTAVVEAPLDSPLEFSSFDDYWQPFLGGQGPAGAYVATLDDAARRQLETRLRTRLLGTGPDRPFVLRGRVWAVRGVVPQVREDAS